MPPRAGGSPLTLSICKWTSRERNSSSSVGWASVHKSLFGANPLLLVQILAATLGGKAVKFEPMQTALSLTKQSSLQKKLSMTDAA